MVKNKASDKKQHERYKKELGDLVPKNFVDFQNLKYNNKDDWDRLSYNYKLETIYNLDKLKNTENFASKGSIKHILEGEINRRGKAVGFHLESMPTAKGSIIESTRSTPDKNGVYSAKVIIDGVNKKAKSTFFPTDWTPQKVVDAINESYINRIGTSTDEFRGITSSGVEIGMYLDEKSKIMTAYPKK